jgi:hypothetical protein
MQIRLEDGDAEFIFQQWQRTLQNGGFAGARRGTNADGRQAQLSKQGAIDRRVFAGIAFGPDIGCHRRSPSIRRGTAAAAISS